MNVNKKTSIFFITAIILNAIFITAIIRTAGVLYISGHNRRLDNREKNIGIYLETRQEVVDLKKRPHIMGWFEDWYTGEVSREKRLLCGKNHVSIPLISWQPSHVPLSEIAEGKHDEYITSYLTQVSQDFPENDVIIRFAHEFESRPHDYVLWFSWQSHDNEANSELYKKAWIRIVNISRRINPNIKWLWSPNKANEYSALYYPGDDYVDYVGVTMNLTTKKQGLYPDFETYYVTEGLKSNLERYDKPILFPEMGFSIEMEDRQADFIRSALDYMDQDEKVIGMVFFNKDISQNRLYKITDKKKTMDVIYQRIKMYE